LLSALAAALAVSLGACGSSPRRTSSVPATQAAAATPSFGITEDDAALLWSPQSPVALAAGAAAAPGAQALARARAQLTALHPRYVRLLVDWAALQPHAGEAPQLERPVSGCARTIGPCAPYAGLREELAAIASQQRHGGGFEAVIVIYGTPAWAARPAFGCERARASAFSRAPTAAGLAAYRGLIHALVGLSAREGVALRWWAPWNEPNDPTFLSPQRSSCAAATPASAPLAYARLAAAMAAQLRAEGGERHLLLGELNAYEGPAFDRTSISEFVATLPAQALCLSGVWAIHVYAARGASAPAQDPVGILERALDARGGCARAAQIWVTEAGTGAPHPGDPSASGRAEELAACRALSRQLALWSGDPRVGAVFQYTFRDDPAFPVGLVDARLDHTYPAYRLWLAWQSERSLAPLARRGACA
jgi:hypothetical protein